MQPPPTKFTMKESETLDGRPLTYCDIDQFPWYMNAVMPTANNTGERTSRIPSPLLSAVCLNFPKSGQHLVVVGDGYYFGNVYLTESGFLGINQRNKIWKLFDYAQVTQTVRESHSLHYRQDPPDFRRLLFMTEFPSIPRKADRETVVYRFQFDNGPARICVAHDRLGGYDISETLDIQLVPNHIGLVNPLITLHKETSGHDWSTPSLDSLLVAGPGAVISSSLKK